MHQLSASYTCKGYPAVAHWIQRVTGMRSGRGCSACRAAADDGGRTMADNSGTGPRRVRYRPPFPLKDGPACHREPVDGRNHRGCREAPSIMLSTGLPHAVDACVKRAANGWEAGESRWTTSAPAHRGAVVPALATENARWDLWREESATSRPPPCVKRTWPGSGGCSRAFRTILRAIAAELFGGHADEPSARVGELRVGG
jgi:hypothetical protein